MLRGWHGWAMVSCVLALSFAARVGAVEPRLKWTFETQGKIYASPVIADLDNDGKSEVLVAASRDKRLICIGCDGEVKWDYRVDDGEGDGIQATPSAIDYDGDGLKEVFFATKGGVVGCVDAHGGLIWRVFTNDAIDYSGPVVADVDLDRRIEVVIGSESGTVYCFDDCGMEKWRYVGDGPVRGIPAVAWDPATKTTGIFVTFGGGAETCLSGSGKLLWNFSEPGIRKERRSGPAIGLFDDDFQLDVVSVTEDFQVIARDAFSGKELWRWAGKTTADQTNSIALADFDHRNRLDIVCADGTGQGGAGHVHRLRNGQELWSADVKGGVVQGPSIGDVDGDGRLEILVCSRSKRLICLDENGQEKWSYPSSTEVLTTPALGDIDGDGKVEIVFSSKDRCVYCLTVDGAYDPALMPWPMISHDCQLSGNIQGYPFTPPAMSAPAPVPDLFLGREVKPIHMGDNLIPALITNNWFRPRHLEVKLAVTLPGGERVTRTMSKRFEPLQSIDMALEFPALYEGTYALVYSLLDVGQGTVVSRTERSDPLDKEADIDPDAKKIVLTKDYMFGDMPEGAAKTRVAEAENKAIDAWNASLEQLKATIGRAEATIQERRAAYKTALDVLAALKHVAARGHALHVTPVPASEFAVIAESPLKKIFKDEPALPPFIAGTPVPRVASLSLCGNEYEGVQIVIVPALKDLKNLRVSLAGDLVQTGGSGKIPAQDVAINVVGYVPVGPPEYNWYVEKQGEYPDVLLPNAPVDVPIDQDAQPFLVTVKAQEQTPAGDYTANLRVEADECPAIEVPLNVHVWNFHIPAKPRFKVSMWMNENSIKAFYKYPDRTPFDVRKRFYQMHLDHRVSPIQTFPLGGGDMMEDFDYLMANGQNCLFVHVPSYVPESDRPALAEKLVATRDLLKSKGWSDATLFYSMDEVAVMQRHLIPQMLDMNAWVKTVIPEWPRLETSAPEQDLFGAVDIWCPTIDNFDPEILRDRMSQGDRLWFYTVWGRPGVMIEFPGADPRVMFWECFKYGAEGFLYWGTTHWDLNSVGDERWPAKPWITYNRQPGHNGCGYLIYPGPDGTPLSSIRFEAVRDGIEDLEYLALLKNLYETRKDQVPPEVAQRAYAELLVPTEVVQDNKTFVAELDSIPKARARIAELLEKFQP